METKKYIELAIVIAVAVASFFGGRATIEPSVNTIHIPGKIIHDTVPLPIVSKEYYTKEVILPMKKDTLWRDGQLELVYMKVDTAAIISDYTLRREYQKVLFDNKTEGKLSIGLKTQYNKLQDNITYDFKPVIEKQIIERIITPYVGINYNSFGYLGVGGGIFYHNIGIDAKYKTNFTDNGIEIGMNIKF